MKLYGSFARAAFANAVIFRFEFWMRLASFTLLMYSLNRVWTILFTQRPGAFGVSLEQMVTYGMLGVILDSLFEVGPDWYMAQQMRTGAIDTDLMKPLDFHAYLLAMSSGEALLNLAVLAIPGLLLAYFFMGLQLPNSLATGLLFALSVVLGFLVLFHLAFLLGSFAMVTMDIRSISWAYYSLVSFFAGQMVPLWLFPDFLRRLAEALPFQSIFYIPMSIYVGTLAGAEALRAMGLQLTWVLLLVAVSRWIWTRLHARLVVQGG